MDSIFLCIMHCGYVANWGSSGQIKTDTDWNYIHVYCENFYLSYYHDRKWINTLCGLPCTGSMYNGLSFASTIVHAASAGYM